MNFSDVAFQFWILINNRIFWILVFNSIKMHRLFDAIGSKRHCFHLHIYKLLVVACLVVHSLFYWQYLRICTTRWCNKNGDKPSYNHWPFTSSATWLKIKCFTSPIVDSYQLDNRGIYISIIDLASNLIVRVKPKLLPSPYKFLRYPT